VATTPPELPPLGEGVAGKAVSKLLPGGQRLSAWGRVVVAFLVAGLLFLAALAAQPWGFIALGFAIGLLVVAGVPAAEAGLMPLAALGRAVLPLLLPLFVFVAAGVVKSPAELQFAVGLTALLVGWFWLVKPDWDQVKAILNTRRRPRSTAQQVGQIGLPIVLVAFVLGLLAISIVGLLGDSDETSRTFFVLSVGALAGAAVLRLLGYARTAFRALVAVALLLLLGRLTVELGVLPGIVLLEDIAPATLAVIAGVALALTAGVEIITSLLSRDAKDESGLPVDELPATLQTAVFLETPVAARWVTDRAGLGGLAVALLSALFLLCAVFAASTAGGAHEDLDRAARAGRSETPPASMDDRTLAATFSPVLTFTSDQRWTPIAVDDYVRGATLTDWERRTAQVAGVAALPTDCPGVVKSPCYEMKQDCGEELDEARCAEDLPDGKAVYVRVARRPDWRGCERAAPCADGSPNPFASARGKHAEDTEILVQYWYFYPFNEWVAPVAIGDLTEIHPADWEAVTVGLSREQPLWVAYSAHCGGTFADWGRIRVAESDPRHLRPLVAVANGSQANYRVAKESRVPNFAQCSGIPKDRLSLASYAANIRDRTDDSTYWEPSGDDLRIVTAEMPPMSFPGRWSPYTRMTLDNLRKSHRLGRDGRGPQTPPLQALWQSPMRTIFGGGAWEKSGS
jgi:hypothetical protein